MGLAEKFARIDADQAAEATFGDFWSLYPRKTAKLDALKAWKQMTQEYHPADIMAGLRRNLPSMERKDRQYIKYPASWLRAGCWMDEPETVPMNGHRRTMLDAVLDRTHH